MSSDSDTVNKKNCDLYNIAYFSVCVHIEYVLRVQNTDFFK